VGIASFFKFADLRSVLSANGLECEVIGPDAYPFGELDRRHAAMSTQQGLEAIRLAIEHSRMVAGVICREVPALASRLSVDALLVDQLEPSGGMVAESLRLAFVTVCNALAFHQELGVPPGFILGNHPKPANDYHLKSGPRKN
jgi:zeaxanthin glucosyltransferase